MPIFRGKNFVSAISDYKDSVRVASRSNINLNSMVLSIDSVSLASSNRVLLAGQSDQKENGIYTWNATTKKLARAFDSDSIWELSAGNKVYVEEGTLHAKSTWTLISQGVITPGVSSLVFAKESSINATDISGTYGGATKTLEITVDETGQLSAVTEYNIAASNLDSLTDVVITTPTSGQVLKYNGTNWVNGTDYTGAGGESSGIALTDISATNASGFGTINYNNTTGVITYTGVSETEIRSQFTAGTGISYNSTTGAISSTITQYTDSDARSAVSVSGDLVYNSATGVISYTAPSLASYATTSYVDTAISGLVNSSPATLDTLKELADALGQDANFSTTITTQIGSKLNSADFNSTFDTQLATKSTTNLTEGTNLYYTDARARSAISASGDVSYNNTTGVISFTRPSPVITLAGDLTGSVTLTSLGNATLTATIAANSVALGTDTTGNYVAEISSGTGVTITNAAGEGSTHSISIGQAIAATDTPTFAGLTLNGLLGLAGTSEKINTKTGATGVVVHDFSTGATFYHSAIAANFTANFTNVPTTADKILGTTLILSQGAAAYLTTDVQIDGVAQTIKWAGGTVPTATANKIDLVTFMFIRVASTWTVLGYLSTFG